MTFNGYAWGSCPGCNADDRQQFALRCRRCRATAFVAECEDHCPECGSGNTAIRARPETLAVR